MTGRSFQYLRTVAISLRKVSVIKNINVFGMSCFSDKEGG